MLYGLLSEIIPKAIPKVICNAAYGTILKANAKAIHGDKHKVHCITIHRSRHKRSKHKRSKHKRSKHKPNCKFIDWNRERAVRSVP